MNSKRSYLDTLNAGRQRRPYATLEQLNRSLENLEQRIDRNREEAADYSRPSELSREELRRTTAMPASAPYNPAYESDMRVPTRQRPVERAPERSAYEQQQPYQAIARDIERVRGQEDGIAAFGKIAGEIKGLREELRQQMTQGVRREFETLRKDMENAYAAGASKATGKLGLEFERLSGAIQTLSERSDDRSVNMLRLEIEQLKQALETLAREETVRSVDRRWDDFDRRFNDFEHKVSADVKLRSSDPGLGALTKRIEQISDAVHHLPESMSFRSLEEKVRTLAGALDHFMSHQGGRVTETFGQIEERLDEISRAIVATTVAAQSPHIDPVPFERIEARISALARQIEEVAEDRPTLQVMDRLNMLSERVDDMAARSGGPEKAIERLALQVAAIADRIERTPPAPDAREIFSGIEQRFDVLSGLMERRQGDVLEQGNMLYSELERRLAQVADKIDRAPAAPDAREIFSGIEQRFEVLSGLMEQRQGDVIEQGNQLFRELERRLDDVAYKIDHAPQGPDSVEIFTGIEQRFDALSGLMERRQGDVIEQGNQLFRELERRLDEVADRIDQRQTDAALDNTGIMGAIDARFAALAQKLETGRSGFAGDDAIKALEARLEKISERIDQSAQKFSTIDSGLVRSLELQVAGLSAHLARPSAPLPELEDIGPRLDEIERSIAGSRETVLEAARHAAENAARSLAGSQAELAAVSGLAQDLKALETLTRRSDERNSKTFEAIHDTLLKIVDRLGSLETETIAAEAQPARKMTLRDAPSIDGGSMADEAMVAPPMPKTSVERSPAQAAAAAAVAAVAAVELDSKAEAEQSRGVRSMLGGLTRRLGGKKEKTVPPLAELPAAVEAAAATMEAAPSVDLDAPLDPKAANRPIEPGTGGPDLNAIMKRVRDERGQPVKHSETDAAKSDFIAAARRAAQAAAAEAEVLKRKSDIAGPVKALRLGDLLKSRRKPILMAAAAVMIALAGLQLGKAFMNDGVETASAPIVAQKQVDTASVGSAAIDSIEAKDGNVVDAIEPDAMPILDGADQTAMGAGPMEPHADQTASTTPPAEAAPMPEIPVETVAVPEAPVMPEMPAATAATTPEVPAETIVASAPAMPEEPAAPAATAAIEVPADAGPLPLREAAAAGDAKALFEVGSRYAEGRGAKADMPQAAIWYEKAAELGFAPAQFRIGNFYEKGLGVSRDVAKAKTWYLAAAEKGNAAAMHNLAVLNAMGADGGTDNEAAAKWFIAAAELGVKDSQFNLGILAAKGVGMPQSLEESYKWFALVAKTGDKDAAAKRDEIANSLRPEQLERARATTELWKPKPLDPEANSVDIPDSWQENQDKTASIDMKKAVQNIQLILSKNGYDAGKPDGVMGGKTKTAIVAFQKDNGLDPTGLVDEKLVGELLKRK